MDPYFRIQIRILESVGSVKIDGSRIQTLRVKNTRIPDPRSGYGSGSAPLICIFYIDSALAVTMPEPVSSVILGLNIENFCSKKHLIMLNFNHFRRILCILSIRQRNVTWILLDVPGLGKFALALDSKVRLG